jgi:hypothetical protein
MLRDVDHHDGVRHLASPSLNTKQEPKLPIKPFLQESLPCLTSCYPARPVLLMEPKVVTICQHVEMDMARARVLTAAAARCQQTLSMMSRVKYATTQARHCTLLHHKVFIAILSKVY